MQQRLCVKTIRAAMGAHKRQTMMMEPQTCACNGVSEIMAPNNFGSALSKAVLKGPLKAVIGRFQLISWTSCGVVKSKPRRRRRRRGAAAAEPSGCPPLVLGLLPCFFVHLNLIQCQGL